MTFIDRAIAHVNTFCTHDCYKNPHTDCPYYRGICEFYVHTDCEWTHDEFIARVVNRYNEIKRNAK